MPDAVRAMGGGAGELDGAGEAPSRARRWGAMYPLRCAAGAVLGTPFSVAGASVGISTVAGATCGGAA